MKKLIFTFGLLFVIGTNLAQSLFDKYEDYDDITSVIVTEEMFNLLKEIEPESQEGKEKMEALSSLTELKVFVTENAKIAKEITADTDKYVKNKKMTELMRINDKDAKVKFYIIKGSQPHIAKELVMSVRETKNDTVRTIIMVATGDINLKKLSKLNSKIKIINGKYLEKVEKEQNK
jgi:DNA-binding protein H-NS